MQLLFYDNDLNTLVPIGIISDYQDDFVVSDPVMTPTFADIDNDGDLDFFTGNVLGTITFYERSITRYHPARQVARSAQFG